MAKLKDEIEKAMRQLLNFDKFKNQIEIKVTPQGLRSNCLNPRPERSLIWEFLIQTPTVKNCLICLLASWENCRTKSPLKDTPTPNLSVASMIMGTGSYPPTALTPPVG